MSFLNASPVSKYDNVTGVLSNAPDLSAQERQSSPGLVGGAGDLATPVTGLAQGFAKATNLLNDAFDKIERPAWGAIDDLFGSKFQEKYSAAYASEKQRVRQTIESLNPDPTTTGHIAQVVHGFSSVLPQFGLGFAAGGPAGAAAVIGSVTGYDTFEESQHKGLSPMQALGMGTIEGGFAAAGAFVPAHFAIAKPLSVLAGASVMTATGMAQRGSLGLYLRSQGFDEMARQYQVIDKTAMFTDATLGALFGLGGRAAPKRQPTPSNVDAALVGNQIVHAEVTAAPGVPINTRSRQAHSEALNSAIESIALGDKVNVEGLLKDAGFLGKRTDFDALALIRTELEKAGIDVEQLRVLEEEARNRGIVVDADSLPSVVKSEAPVEIKTGGVTLGESRVKIGNDYVPTELRLVDANDVAATMSKAENQFRDRTRVASDQQIKSISDNLDPALLGDFPVMDHGAPVLHADGRVIGGNGRAAAIARAYADGKAEGYRASLGEAAIGMKAPMLVRILKQDVDVARASMLSNEGGALRMSALEQAKVDGERLGSFTDFQFQADGSIDGAANMPFIRRWVGEVPDNQRAALMDADGRLSAEGLKRLQNAILYRAYGDSPTLSRLVESTDEGARNIARAMTRVAPAVADAKAAILRGDLHALDLSDDIVGAVEKLDALKRTDQSVSDWLKQHDAFGDPLAPEARVLAAFLDQSRRSSTVMADGIRSFYQKLTELGHPDQASMFEAAAPDKMLMLQLALEDATPMYSRGKFSGQTSEHVIANLRAQLGADADRLLEHGRLVVVDRVSDLPGDGHPSDVGGMFWRGKAYMVAENTAPSMVRGVALHEVGVHAGMLDMLGPKLYKETIDHVVARAQTDPVFQAARDMAEARSNKPEHVPEETLAYLVEYAPELGVVRRLLAEVRQWVYRTTGGRFVDMNQADLQQLAAASLRRHARAAETAARGDEPWYMTLFQGGPSVFHPEPGAPLGRLRWDKINTGEGAQYKGYGHYAAQQEYIARVTYRDRLIKQKGLADGLEIPHNGGILKINKNDNEPAWYIGDQIVHSAMGGEEAALANAAAQVQRYGYERAKTTLESLVRVSELAVKGVIKSRSELIDLNEKFDTHSSDAEKSQYEKTLKNATDVLNEYKASLAAVDKVVTFNSYDPIKANQYRLRSDIKEVPWAKNSGSLHGHYLPDHVVDNAGIWDAPLADNPQSVQDAFLKLGIMDDPFKDGMTYADAYHKLADMIENGEEPTKDFPDRITGAHFEAFKRRAPEGVDPMDPEHMDNTHVGSQEAASIMLHHAGVPLHRFLDGFNKKHGNWTDPNATFNFVLYSDDLGGVAWKAQPGDKQWLSANGRGEVVKAEVSSDIAAMRDIYPDINIAGPEKFNVKVDGVEVGGADTIERAMRLAEDKMDGQFFSRTGASDKLDLSTIEVELQGIGPDGETTTTKLPADQAVKDNADRLQQMRGLLACLG